MATFYPDPLSNESLEQQRQRYFQTRPLITNIEDIIQTQTKDYKNIIEQSTQQQIESITNATETVCGTIESGYNLLSIDLQNISYGVNDVSNELNYISSILDWNFSLFIEQQRITNLLLGNIAILLRIPDIQKERQYYIEQGIKFLKNAFYDPDFYEDALKNFLKVETIEPSDFFSLQRIGMIYLSSPKHKDFKKAEDYFRKAAKYSIAEMNSGVSINTNLLSQVPTIEEIKLQTAESYLFAGRSCYKQGKYAEAADLAEKSYKIVPKLVEAGFLQAKALCAENNISQAAIVLETVIEKDKFYSIKTVKDLDLISKPEVVNVLEKLRQRAFLVATNLLSECKRNMIRESIAKERIRKLEVLISKRSYLHCKRAIELMNKIHTRTLPDLLQANNNYYNYKNLCELKYSLTTISKTVKYPDQHLPLINNLFNILSENTQWNFPVYKNFADAINYNDNYESKRFTSTLKEFIVKEKEYFDKLPFINDQISITIQEIYSADTKKRNYDDLEVKKARNKELEYLEYLQNRKHKERIFYMRLFAKIGGIFGAIFGVIISDGIRVSVLPTIFFVQSLELFWEY